MEGGSRDAGETKEKEGKKEAEKSAGTAEGCVSRREGCFKALILIRERIDFVESVLRRHVKILQDPSFTNKHRSHPPKALRLQPNALQQNVPFGNWLNSKQQTHHQVQSEELLKRHNLISEMAHLFRCPTSFFT